MKSVLKLAYEVRDILIEEKIQAGVLYDSEDIKNNKAGVIVKISESRMFKILITEDLLDKEPKKIAFDIVEKFNRIN